MFSCNTCYILAPTEVNHRHMHTCTHVYMWGIYMPLTHTLLLGYTHTHTMASGRSVNGYTNKYIIFNKQASTHTHTHTTTSGEFLEGTAFLLSTGHQLAIMGCVFSKILDIHVMSTYASYGLWDVRGECMNIRVLKQLCCALYIQVNTTHNAFFFFFYN